MSLKMCLNPRTIVVKNDFPFPAPHYVNLGRFREITVPCGKCSECLTKRQNAFVQRVYSAMQHYKYAWFVTFTYRDKSLPIYCSLVRTSFEPSTGEFVSEDLIDSKRLFLGSSLEPFVRGKLLAQKSSSKPRYFSSPFRFNLDGCDYEYKYVFTFSICREDWRMWIKKARIQFQREFGRPLHEFKYLTCGEMGPKTSRPHLHSLFMSDSPDFSRDLDWILQKWQRSFGFTQKKFVNYVNEDGSNGALKVSRYIGKYVSKGKFECDSVKEGYAEKGRICASINLGSEDFPGPMLSWYFAFDLYGPYNPNTLVLERTKTKLQGEQLLNVLDSINRRLFFTFPDGKRFPFSHYFRNKLFTYYTKVIKDGKEDYLRYKSGSRKAVRYYVSFLASERFQSLQDADHLRKLERALSRVPEEDRQDCLRRFSLAEESGKKARELDTYKTLERFYSNSKF